jgi:hypothetical protein
MSPNPHGKIDLRDAVARELARVKFEHSGPQLTSEQLMAMEDVLCINGRFPAAFRAFLERQNGGMPSPSVFSWQDPHRGTQIANLSTIFGLDPAPLGDPKRRVDCIRMTLKLRNEVPNWAIVIVNVDRDDWLITYEDGPFVGEVWIKRWQEVPVTVDEPPDVMAGLYRVSNTFDGMLRLLRNGET